MEISTNQYFAAKFYTPTDAEEIENVCLKNPPTFTLFIVLYFLDP